MLTRGEKELLEALKAHMDDEQKEAVSEMTEEELKGLLKEAKKEMEKEMISQGVPPQGCLGKLRYFRDCPWREIWSPQGRLHGNGTGLLEASVLKLLLKIGSTKVGCGLLIVIAIIIAIVIAANQ